MVQDKLSAFFPPVCACLEMTGARARLCPGSRHQAGLAVIWGEKGRKAEHLAVASGDASAWLGVGGYTVAGGDSAVAAIVRKLQIDQIVEARLWAYYLGHVNVSLVSSWSQGQIKCVCLCAKSRRFKSQNWILRCVCVCVRVCVCLVTTFMHMLFTPGLCNRAHKHQHTVSINTSVTLTNTLR